MSELEFYNQQYAKYGRYDHNIRQDRTLDLSNAEDYFESLIRQASSKEHTLVDLGCGDGLFTASLAPLNASVIGIEPSDLIEHAIELVKAAGIENLSFVREQAENLSLSDASIDIAISRRGPNPAKELARVLKPNGLFIFITIGEQDCAELKEVVGRGQHFGDPTKVADKLHDLFQAQGFEILECRDFVYTENYESEAQLVEFLHQVPIFDDFGEKDYDCISHYSKQHDQQEIPLNRHRVVLKARWTGRVSE